ncbi:acyltransferase family protein [uncultured Bacteroides sp.]|uniref:acyltransferase family protein n=1 Tax=uncultured Bacteroides sp. TaxID=162156 RepID=UPI002609F003|nr:acyltransferase family protein [uncultured Bacteroides sp.]
MNKSDVLIERKEWIDWARGVLMFLVFVYHSEVYYGDGHTWSWTFAPFFLTGFFFISGYLFCKDINTVSLAKKCKSVVKGILIPYLFFTVLFILPKALYYQTDINQLTIDVVMFRASWFVVVIGLLQLVYAFVLHKNPSNIKLHVVTVTMFAIGYLSVFFYEDLPLWVSNSAWLQSPMLPNRFPFCLNIALVMCPFFYLGIVYRQIESRIKISFGGLVAIIAAYITIMIVDKQCIGSSITVVTHKYVNLPLVYLYGLLGTMVVIEISKKIYKFKFINYIGKHSILFYFLNGVALQFTTKIANIITNNTNINGGGYCISIKQK